MGKVNIGKPEKRGRGRPPRPEGRDPVIAVRLPRDALAVVDDYAAEMGGITRSKALRDMVAHAIEHWAKMKKRRKP
jgi:Ribbon-helix-helix protein, copG family